MLDTSHVLLIEAGDMEIRLVRNSFGATHFLPRSPGRGDSATHDGQQGHSTLVRHPPEHVPCPLRILR